MKTCILSLSFFLLLHVVGCKAREKIVPPVIAVQPFTGIDPVLTDSIAEQIKRTGATVYIRPPMDLPTTAFYTPRQRFRADSLIRILSASVNGDTIVIGLTAKDISTTKGTVQDWGVMGLGYCPGRACIVSTHRLQKENLYAQFYKIALHELGHTQSLPRCSNKTCFMRDAAGGNPLNEETDFCARCRGLLRKRGWQMGD